jgi:hypothetical protein
MDRANLCVKGKRVRIIRIRFNMAGPGISDPNEMLVFGKI